MGLVTEKLQHCTADIYRHFTMISTRLEVLNTMGALKTREWTTWEWNCRHDETGVDNAGVDKAAR